MHELIERFPRSGKATATPSGRSRITAPANSRCCRAVFWRWPRAVAPFRPHFDLRGASHPRAEIAVDLDQGRRELLQDTLSRRTAHQAGAKGFLSNILGDTERFDVMAHGFANWLRRKPRNRACSVALESLIDDLQQPLSRGCHRGSGKAGSGPSACPQRMR